jgi:hypothetical protein
VLLLDVLEHVPVPQQIAFLRAIHGSLVKGGQLIVQVPNANSMLAARWRYNDFTHHSSFTEHSLYFVLKVSGFAEARAEAVKSIIRPSLRFWKREVRSTAKAAWRRFLVRWFWVQVFKAELPNIDTDRLSMELNLRAVGVRRD